MKEQVDSTITSVQRIRPNCVRRVDDLGLVAAIEWQCRDFQRRTGIVCHCTVSHEDLRVDPEQATPGLPDLSGGADQRDPACAGDRGAGVPGRPGAGLVLRVRDNGRGIPQDRLTDARSFGLLGMQERAGLLGGDVQIETQEGNGTTIVPTICLDREGW